MTIFSCKHASHLVSESMDHPLAVRERMTLFLHLVMCSLCRRFRRQMTAISQAIRSVRHSELLPEIRLSDEARVRIRKSLHDQ